MYSTESNDFINEIQSDLPLTKVKGLTGLAIAEIIMQILALIIKYWRERNPNVPVQQFWRSQGFLKRFVMKRAIKSQAGRDRWNEDLFEQTLDKATRMPYNKLSSIASKDLNIQL